MRVKLIGVSDEARKSESVVQAKHDYRPRWGDRIEWFDDSFVENKLPYPTSSRPKEQMMSDETAHALDPVRSVKPPSRQW
jgi:hypothetical protein